MRENTDQNNSEKCLLSFSPNLLSVFSGEDHFVWSIPGPRNQQELFFAQLCED